MTTSTSRLLRLLAPLLAAALFAACSTRAPLPAAPPAATPAPAPAPTGPLTGQPAPNKSRWVPVAWSELPGFDADALHEAWNAWLRSCERPAPAFVPLCGDVRRLSIASAEEQRAWMVERLQPYRVESLEGATDGLLTGYFEPYLEAARQPGNGFDVPLYRPPADLATRRPWYTRQQIDTLPEARAQLAG
ncbi:MAG TPA: transglycosylase, partial [Comamonadaceae bacterium]|nr:transglycosylase [Comamonadaceae bacterium]